MADKAQVLGQILNYLGNQQNAKDARIYDREKTSRTFAQQDDLAKSNKEFQLAMADMERKYATERDIAIQEINAERDADNKAWQMQMQEMTNNLTAILNKQKLDHEESLMMAKENFAQQRMVLGSSLATGEYEAKSNIQMKQADNELDRALDQSAKLAKFTKDQEDKAFMFPSTNYQAGLAEREIGGLMGLGLYDSEMTEYLNSGMRQFEAPPVGTTGPSILKILSRIANKTDATPEEKRQLKIGQDYLKDLYKAGNVRGYIDDDIISDDKEELDTLNALIQMMKQAGIKESYFDKNPLAR